MITEVEKTTTTNATIRYQSVSFKGRRRKHTQTMNLVVFQILILAIGRGVLSFTPSYYYHNRVISRDIFAIFSPQFRGIESPHENNFPRTLLFASTPEKKTFSQKSRHNGDNTEKRFAVKLAEMRDRDAGGEKLSQAFCDNVLASCVASDEWDSVLDVLEVMKNQGLVQERSSYRACLQECFETGNGASAREILNAMRHADVEPEPIDVSLGVVAMCKNDKNEPGWWRRALGILKATADNAKEGSGIVPVEAYDAVLTCMANQRQWKDASRLLNLMEQGFNPEKTSFHPTPVLSTYHAVVENCVAANQAEQAVQVLLSMNSKGVQPNVYTFELVIGALSKKQLWRRALQLLDIMDDLNISQTVVTYNTVISACARAKEVGTAKSLLIKMRKRGIQPNVISFNSLMNACAGARRWKDALALLKQCSDEPGVEPDIITYTNAIRACSRGGNTRRALSLLDVVKEKELPLDVYCYTAVIDACAKAKLWRRALALLDEMRQNNIQPNDFTYSVAISACGNGGQWSRALELLYQMKEKGMKINVITYNSAITALSKASRQNAKQSSRLQASKRIASGGKIGAPVDVDEEQLWIRALELLEQMKADGLEPDGFSYSAAIGACGAGGRWKEALELIKIMQFGGPRTRPNKIAYTSAISACGRAGEWQHAMKLFSDMKNQGLQPDLVAYNALVSALRVSDMADMAFEVWEEMCGKEQTKPIPAKGRRASAKAPASMSPDIITLTNVIDALDHNEDRDNIDRIDQVFAEAVKRNIILRAGLDSSFEVDFSGMSFPVARAACRHIIHQFKNGKQSEDSLHDLMIITGVGKSHMHDSVQGSAIGGKDKNKIGATGALREHVRAILRDDFEPKIFSNVPERAQGTVCVKKDMLQKWIAAQTD